MPDKLLLINASIANRAVFKITFKGRRDIQAARDAGEAMRFADRTPPDLIALDIGDDQDAGIVHGMTRHFRNAPVTRSTPIVLLAGAAQESIAIRGLALGAVDFIVKPLSPLVLAARSAPSISPMGRNGASSARRMAGPCGSSTAACILAPGG